MSIDISRNIDVANKGTHRVETRGVRGPPRAAELSLVEQGCSPAVVGAQLWFLRSSAAKKAEYVNGVDSPSGIMAVGAASRDGGAVSPNSKIVGTSEMVR